MSKEPKTKQQSLTLKWTRKYDPLAFAAETVGNVYMPLITKRNVLHILLFYCIIGQEFNLSQVKHASLDPLIIIIGIVNVLFLVNSYSFPRLLFKFVTSTSLAPVLAYNRHREDELILCIICTIKSTKS